MDYSKLLRTCAHVSQIVIAVVAVAAFFYLLRPVDDYGRLSRPSPDPGPTKADLTPDMATSSPVRAEQVQQNLSLTAENQRLTRGNKDLEEAATRMTQNGALLAEAIRVMDQSKKKLEADMGVMRAELADMEKTYFKVYLGALEYCALLEFRKHYRSRADVDDLTRWGHTGKADAAVDNFVSELETPGQSINICFNQNEFMPPVAETRGLNKALLDDFQAKVEHNKYLSSKHLDLKALKALAANPKNRADNINKLLVDSHVEGSKALRVFFYCLKEYENEDDYQACLDAHGDIPGHVYEQGVCTFFPEKTVREALKEKTPATKGAEPKPVRPKPTGQKKPRNKSAAR